MNCNKCNNSGVLNTVLNKDFYYCRVCKEEIILTVGSTPELKPLSMIKQLAYHKIQTFHNNILTIPVIISRQTSGTMHAKPRPAFEWLIPSNLDLELKDWLPASIPRMHDNFCGIDRYLDLGRLAGSRYHANSNMNNILDQLLDIVNFINRNGARRDCVILPKAKYAKLELELGGLTQDILITPNHGSVPINGLRLAAKLGSISVVFDETIDPDKGYVIDLNTWEYDKVLVCNSPIHNGVILF